jgi:hypothetical protein
MVDLDEDSDLILQQQLPHRSGISTCSTEMLSALRSGSVWFLAQNLKNQNCNWSIVFPNLAKTEPD